MDNIKIYRSKKKPSHFGVKPVDIRIRVKELYKKRYRAYRCKAPIFSIKVKCNILRGAKSRMMPINAKTGTFYWPPSIEERSCRADLFWLNRVDANTEGSSVLWWAQGQYIIPHYTGILI